MTNKDKAIACLLDEIARNEKEIKRIEFEGGDPTRCRSAIKIAKRKIEQIQDDKLEDDPKLSTRRFSIDDYRSHSSEHPSQLPFKCGNDSNAIQDLTETLAEVYPSLMEYEDVIEKSLLHSEHKYGVHRKSIKAMIRRRINSWLDGGEELPFEMWFDDGEIKFKIARKETKIRGLN